MDWKKFLLQLFCVGMAIVILGAVVMVAIKLPEGVTVSDSGKFEASGSMKAVPYKWIVKDSNIVPSAYVGSLDTTNYFIQVNYIKGDSIFYSIVEKK